MGISNASEIDRVKLTFDMPQGLKIIDTVGGEDHESYFELEIFLNIVMIMVLLIIELG